MRSIRVVTYNINSCRGEDGRKDPERIARVLAAQACDLIALQDVEDDVLPDQLQCIADYLGMKALRDPSCGRLAFITSLPVRGLRYFDLHGGGCLAADAEVEGKLIHLFNLRLCTTPHLRRQQITQLLGPDLLAGSRIVCPTLILGDFADLWWGGGNFNLTLLLQKVKRPLWAGTYPARFPLFGRDRAYFQGDIKVVSSRIDRSPLARSASCHLPFQMTLRIADCRRFLKVKELKPGRMEIAPG